MLRDKQLRAVPFDFYATKTRSFLFEASYVQEGLVMNQSIKSRYVTRMEATNSTPKVWKWPQKRDADQPIPDPRLLKGVIAGLQAEISLNNGLTVDAKVRATSQHDLVLLVDDLTRVPVNGQVVDVTLRFNNRIVCNSRKSILHWSGLVNDQGVIALFTIEPMGNVVARWKSAGERGEVRFPIDAPAVLNKTNGEEAFGRIIDYSLSGCRFHCPEAVELGVEYASTVLFQQATIDVHVTPRWVLNSDNGFQLGCTFREEQGVMMACRHHPQPTGLSSPLRPQTTNWTDHK